MRLTSHRTKESTGTYWTSHSSWFRYSKDTCAIFGSVQSACKDDFQCTDDEYTKPEVGPRVYIQSQLWFESPAFILFGVHGSLMLAFRNASVCQSIFAAISTWCPPSGHLFARFISILYDVMARVWLDTSPFWMERPDFGTAIPTSDDQLSCPVNTAMSELG